MLYREHSVCAPACQYPDVASGPIVPPAHPAPPAIVAWARTGPVDVGGVIAAVVRAYTALDDLADDVTVAAILGPGRTPTVAQARHLCTYLLMEDARLTCVATAKALGGRDHSTILHSRARVAAALGHDEALDDLLSRARAALAGRIDDARLQVRCEVRRQRGLDETSPRERDEYRYWRLQALRSPRHGAMGGA